MIFLLYLSSLKRWHAFRRRFRRTISSEECCISGPVTLLAGPGRISRHAPHDHHHLPRSLLPSSAKLISRTADKAR